MPDCLRGRILPSTEIAALLKRTRKTLRLWERQGHGPQGMPWPAGKHVTGNMVIYDLEQIWKTVSFYLERNFNHDRRWMGALLQASFKIDDKKCNLLEALVEKEERKMK